MKARLRSLAREDAYSLVEVTVVLVMLVVVLTAVTTVFVSGSKAEVDVNRRFQAQLEATTAFDKLRRDIHCASGATVTGTGGSTLTLTGCGSGTVSWCAVTNTTFPPYALYRKTGSTCNSTGHLYAGNATLTGLARSALFAAPAAATGYVPKVTVDLMITPPMATANEAFELIDEIVMRNADRA